MKCELCQQEFSTVSGQMARHLKIIHGINIEDFPSIVSNTKNIIQQLQQIDIQALIAELK